MPFAESIHNESVVEAANHPRSLQMMPKITRRRDGFHVDDLCFRIATGEREEQFVECTRILRDHRLAAQDTDTHTPDLNERTPTEHKRQTISPSLYGHNADDRV